MTIETLEYAYGGVTFRGELARPDAQDRPRPGILVVHEGTGITEHAKHRAREDGAGFQQELTEAGVDWHLLVNGGAGHGFTNPASTNLGVPGVPYDANAERRSFAAMRDFFDALFGAP